MEKLTRRDTIKLALSLPVGIALSNTLSSLSAGSLLPNVIVVVLDALTAGNMSLYGYPRTTTPNIERFAQKGTVYHSHYSSATFTSPGVASLLTGMYPWTHRAINVAGVVTKKYPGRNIFNFIGSSHKRIAFSQNINADILLRQFNDALDDHLPLGSFGEFDQYISDSNETDSLVKYRSFDGFLYANRPGSLVFGAINKYLEEYKASRMLAEISMGRLQNFERDMFFKIEDMFKGLALKVKNSSAPFLAYFHLYPPHEPYAPSMDFKGLFSDDWKPPVKPNHNLLVNRDSNKQLRERRLLYDQYIATVDSAFGHFIDEIKALSNLNNTFVVLVSDHGQMFERGVEGHLSPLVYDPAVRIPLIISAPGQQTRQDVFSATNNVDLLPTLLKITGYAVPEWCEGQLLPGFGGKEDFERTVFSMDAKENAANGILTTVSIAMRKGKYKLIYYKGYTAYRGFPNDLSYNQGAFELYDMENDPEELSDILTDSKSFAAPLQEELLESYHVFSQIPK
ncbi:MAG: sulfatase-like hydrolase/transferase [Anaerolineales bacterium]|nr:sulfatase-like hydrolase/transferase [Anaerolineales bacterium]